MKEKHTLSLFLILVSAKHTIHLSSSREGQMWGGGEVGAMEEFISRSLIIGQNHLFSLQNLGLHPSPHQLAPPCHMLRLCPPMN